MLSKSTITAIKQGKIGVIPTDTVYGVVASAQDEAAVTRLYQLKAREAKPGTVVAASIEQLVDLGIPRRYLVAVQQYWPNSISIIIPVGFKLPYLHQGKGSLAVRIPGDQAFREALQATGPLLTSSANQPGKPPATTLEEAKAYFGDQVDFYQDGGNLSGREASTIIRVIDDAVEVIRQGAVKVTDAGDVAQ